MTTPMNSSQQHSEGSTDIEHTLYSHTTNSTPRIYSFQKPEYIYQHFQDSENTHELDPVIDRQTSDSTLYPYINNNIEYSLFEDVISSYYVDSQFKDDFNCDQDCYANTPNTQQNHQLTTCTRA